MKVLTQTALHLYSKVWKWCTITSYTWQSEPHGLARGNSQALETVTLGNSLETIGSAAFYGVKNIILTDAQKTLTGYPWGAKKVNGETP